MERIIKIPQWDSVKRVKSIESIVLNFNRRLSWAPI